jgi:RNA polymerase sigma factor (sigma-70 family)
VRDGEIVAAIVAGDQAALAAAYDHYAPSLYAYCRSMIGDPVDAATAVQDTFVVAAAKLGGLRDPGRLRPWLYAVARNECRRQRHGYRAGPPGDDESTAIGEQTADFGTALDQAGLRELVRSALAGLSPADQEIVELSLRHEFYGADLADVVGIPRNQANVLAARARTRFETSLGALQLARSGQGSCLELADLLASWDGELTGAARRQVRRHVAGCPLCGEYRRRHVNAVPLLGSLPPEVLPASLRYQVLGLITDTTPESLGYFAEVANRAEPFGRSGFPVPLDPLAARRGPAMVIPAAGVLVAVFAVFGGGAMLAANIMRHPAAPITSQLAPAQPSAQAAPAVHTPGPKKGHHGHRTAGRRGSPGSSGYSYTGSTTAAASSAGATSRAASPSTSKGRHTTAPPSSTPPTSPHSPPPSSPTPPASPTPTPSATAPTSGSSGGSGGTLGGVLGGIIGLLATPQ